VEGVAPSVARRLQIALMDIVLVDERVAVGHEPVSGCLQHAEIAARILNGFSLRVASGIS